jgi:hypothetical protein
MAGLAWPGCSCLLFTFLSPDKAGNSNFSQLCVVNGKKGMASGTNEIFPGGTFFI